MTFKLESLNAEDWLSNLAEKVRRESIDCTALMDGGEVPIFEKYDDYIPPELLRRAYAIDRLRADEVITRIFEWEQEEFES